MQVEVFFTPHQIDEMYLRDKTVVVIDVLRASTTIATALHNGAKEIIPVPTVESAMKIIGNLDDGVTLLGGERNGRMIEGFHLGNSPLEYFGERVKGKSIVFSTTNGSQAIVKARHAKEMAVLGFVNISAIENFIYQSEPVRREQMTAGGETAGEAADIVAIVCAGQHGFFSMEDTVCAGMLIQKLIDGGSCTITFGDAGAAALALYKSQSKSILKMIRNSEHGKYLEEIGFGTDLEVCAAVDSIPVVPRLLGNVVKLKKDPESTKVSILS